MPRPVPQSDIKEFFNRIESGDDIDHLIRIEELKGLINQHSDEMSAFQFALHHGNTDAMLNLIVAGADISIDTSDGNSMFHKLVDVLNCAKFQKNLNQQVNHQVPNIQKSLADDRALKVENAVKLIGQLIEKGEDLSAVNNEGLTPFDKIVLWPKSNNKDFMLGAFVIIGSKKNTAVQNPKTSQLPLDLKDTASFLEQTAYFSKGVLAANKNMDERSRDNMVEVLEAEMKKTESEIVEVITLESAGSMKRSILTQSLEEAINNKNPEEALDALAKCQEHNLSKTKFSSVIISSKPLGPIRATSSNKLASQEKGLSAE